MKEPKFYHYYGKGKENKCETVMELSDELITASWENLNEGWCGEYDPDDKDDENLLRFSVYIYDGKAWESVEDASYCTTVSSKATEEELKTMLLEIFRAYRSETDEYPLSHSVRKLGERLSRDISDEICA